MKKAIWVLTAVLMAASLSGCIWPGPGGHGGPMQGPMGGPGGGGPGFGGPGGH